MPPNYCAQIGWDGNRKVLIVATIFCFGSSNIETAYAITGTPGSTKTTYNSDGSVKQERIYGEDGRAEKDVDYNHGGVGHTFPHEHTWDWSTDPPTRQDGVPVPPTPCPAPTPDQSPNTGKTGANEGQAGMKDRREVILVKRL